MEVIVLAGGFGTRLSHIVSDVPKPMAPVAGKPFLEYILSDAVAQGADHIVIAVHHMKECIMDYFGDHCHGVPISYSVEEHPLKTGGAIKKAMELCTGERAVVINGDTFYGVPLKEMHQFAKQSGKQVVITVKEMTKFSRYGKVDVNSDGLITAFHEKEFCEKGYINGGIYDIAKTALEQYPEAFSIEEVCFPELLKRKEIMAFSSNAYFIDIGVPEDYAKAQVDFQRM
jgi:D-glycero-alpha-D-manno-heptose 1-phosphate guanylyltransferase